MTTRPDDLGEFLRSRRARLSPGDVGLAARAGGRRVAGLRREELALLAGVSPDYYARLEQGRATNVSDQVLDAVAAALRLDAAERRHLAGLVRPRRVVQREAVPVRPELSSMIDALDPVPALLHDPCFHVLAVNRMGRVVLQGLEPGRNLVHWTFTAPHARQVYQDWDDVARQLVAALRMSDGTGPGAAAVLAEQLSAQSADFARMWVAHEVRRHTHGPKRFHNDAVGEMTLHYETMTLGDDTGLAVTLYTAEPGSRSAARLAELARQTNVAATGDRPV